MVGVREIVEAASIAIESLYPMTFASLASAPSLALAWDLEPLLVIPLVAIAALYLALVGPLRARYWPRETVSRAQVWFFLTGVLALGVGLLSPLNWLAMEYLLSAHMTQHVLFTVVGPPLLLLGTPSWLVEPLFRTARAQKIGRWLTHPVIAFGLYNLNMWVWHAPALLDATPPAGALLAMRWLNLALIVPVGVLLALVGPGLMRALLDERRWGLVAASAGAGIVLLLSALTILSSSSWALASQPHNPIHTLMDLMFILTALLYWAPILNPAPQLPRIAPLFGMLYLFISTQPMMALGALMTLAAHPLYSLYASAPRLLGAMTPMLDQQLAGLIMWLVMDIPLLIGISILFFRWMRQQEREQERMERMLTPEEEFIWQQQTTAERHHTPQAETSG